VKRLVALALTALLLPACGGKKAAAPTTTQTAAQPDASGCATVDQPKPEDRSGPKSFPKLDPAKTYDVVLKTNCGSFTIRLAVRTSPKTTASFANLVRRGYFDGTVFHRIAVGFVIQGGDPTASGTGGPGYSTVDKPPASTQYTFGLVAMAKTQAEAPGTAGSQFFVVTGKNIGLPPIYGVLGRVSGPGLDVVKRIGALGDPSEQPTRVVEIEKATLHVR
jgi:peptidyl-prolyl cis-trans isomerase B (cyclophilin B)